MDILIIEDNAITALDIRRTIENLGHNVLGVVKSDVDAIKIAEGHNIDIIFSDINLGPGNKTGIEIVEEIQEIQNVVVIYITAYYGQNIIEAALKTQPVAYLVKPFNRNNIIEQFNNALEKFM